MARIVSRRRVLLWLGRGLGLLTLAPQAACRRGPARRDAGTGGGSSARPLRRPPPLPAWARALETFDPTQARIAEAVLERMIPSGIPEGSPGARETRALLHLDRALASKAYRGYARLIRDGLDRLDHEARRRHDAPFPALPPAQQDALLAEWQRRPRRPRAYPSAHFFALVFAFGLEGYLGDPIHGGNHDRLAWRWIDFDPECPTPSGHCGPSKATP